ncbi:hypothetical protein MMAN_52300 [Mycobacterium mantenii]|uniref:Uncharacterized protein n=1 Tax=Mycobacterium mantenii TaxID=560555 RepID=A0ABN6AHK1_MYCNT|nr:hypothetical protein MMAN_52300 [Mycobacterium mantenii]
MATNGYADLPQKWVSWEPAQRQIIQKCSRIEVAAVGPGAAARESDLSHQPSVSGGVTGIGDPEHAAANVDHFAPRGEVPRRGC